ncbi:MAG: hypothetical protein A2Z21_10560 [Candidatus Fraserbacteria bacterium RBG_16_55_9]|uniref:Uncharacterized protein n=1 Tax=Fraserbacteria sp. (strain RBG_16_55_9) TaxID=1817864 RepID=A0A1F5UPT9_FRAXR|nr:MAG: hypothetical protein A2Z21_10560 [Candidatus Fraserbacteria bacterium RBG_16_55_9]
MTAVLTDGSISLTSTVLARPEDLKRALYLRRVRSCMVVAMLGGGDNGPGWDLAMSDLPTEAISAAYAKVDPIGAAQEEKRHAEFLEEGRRERAVDYQAARDKVRESIRLVRDAIERQDSTAAYALTPYDLAMVSKNEREQVRVLRAQYERDH